MTIILADRVQHIQPSATLALSARANKLKAEGKDVLNLTVGEPDFDTPEHIKEAAIRALHDGFTKYTPVDGIKSLKNAIVKKFNVENNLNFSAEEIIVSCGAKQAIYNLAQVILNPGDEVIIPAPYWVSYPEIVQLAGGQPVAIPTSLEQRFKITPEQLKNAITAKTRMIIINSPSNPSGIAYSKQELQQLAEVLLHHPQIIIATDDIYEHILWNEKPFQNILNVCPELRERVVIINGVSKSYAMTGWRIGYAAGPKALIAAMTIVQSQSTSNPNSIAQVAAQAALESDQQCVREMCNVYHQRYKEFSAGLNSISWLQCIPIDGTFYIFAKINSEHNDMIIAEQLLQQCSLALVPGTAFGIPQHLRFSFATVLQTLKHTIERLKSFIIDF